jgi:molybdopterin-guanine dinucleotide biosynthesis protein A
MGFDKAVVMVGGRAMVVRVVDALDAAGSSRTVVVGGDAAALAVLGIDSVADAWPELGPLGGIATALRVATEDISAVLACDLLDPDPTAIERVVAALAADPQADLAVPHAGGRRQWLHAAWRRRAGPALEAAIDAGERAVHRAVAAQGLRVVTVQEIPAGAVADADTPDRLPPNR